MSLKQTGSEFYYHVVNKRLHVNIGYIMEQNMK